ncbi:MAG: (2Fe-2S)-binding protein [Deltaproteobacteria bacterium]|nr:(2Fe-2S)-binding protein [Deltaproteobacteria bacterium]
MSPRQKRQLSLEVNGEPYELLVEPHWLLVDVLRDQLHLTGTKIGCGIGVCGACTVLVDGQAVSSCLALAVDAHGKAVTTIEGLAREGRLHPIQQAFIACGGFQCGFCTPGMIMGAKELLDRNPAPTEEEIRAGLSGNLCRCTGYVKIIESVQVAVRLLQEEMAGEAGAPVSPGPGRHAAVGSGQGGAR